MHTHTRAHTHNADASHTTHDPRSLDTRRLLTQVWRKYGRLALELGTPPDGLPADDAEADIVVFGQQESTFKTDGVQISRAALLRCSLTRPAPVVSFAGDCRICCDIWSRNELL